MWGGVWGASVEAQAGICGPSCLPSNYSWQSAAGLVLHASKPSYNFLAASHPDLRSTSPPFPGALQSVAELVLRADSPFNFCVVDEVDSILISDQLPPLPPPSFPCSLQLSWCCVPSLPSTSV